MVGALVGTLVVVATGTGASASVTSVSGRAFGYYSNVGFFGSSQSVRGFGQVVCTAPNTPAGCVPDPQVTGVPASAAQSPSVVLPSAGGSPPSQSDPDGALGVYGPARIFESHGTMTVSTQGTTGATGSVTSSAQVNDIQPQDPFMAAAPGGVSSTCTANETGLSGSTTITNGRLTLQDPDPDVSGEPGEVVVIPPVNPAPGTEYAGLIANVDDYFTIVFNEQLRTPDSITVNAVHMFMEGPTAVGDMVIGQSQCGVVATTANQAPVANDDAYSTGAGQALTMPAAGVLANDSDPESSPLTASKIAPTPPPQTGTSCPGFPARCPIWGSPSKPANGSLTLNANGSFTYTPNAGFTGTDSFVYTASDQRGKSDTATVTIAVTSATYLSVSDVWLAEGNAGTSLANFTITRTGNTSGASTVSYNTTNGTAVAPSDYTAMALTPVTFAAGETTKPVAVTVIGNTTPEANEAFNVVLSAPSGAVISDTTGVGTIINDDGWATVLTYLSVNDVVVTEGNAGTVTASFTISRTGKTTGSTTVSYKTTDGTATAAGGDYTAIALTPVTFAAGETTKLVAVSVTGDTVDEVNEAFTVNLSAATGGAVVTDSVGTGTIVDDDGAITPGPTTFFTVNDVSVTEGNSGTSVATFTVNRSGNTAAAGSVKFVTANTTAIAPGDYTARPSTLLSFAAGDTTKTVTVNVIGDTLAEANETFKLNLTTPVGGVISDASGIGTIVNDDLASIRVTDVSVTEGNSGTKVATFVLTRSGSIAGSSTVSYKTTNGTAASGTDYTAIALTPVTFAAGETTKVVSVTVTGDAVVEPNETFTVNLSAAVTSVVSDTAGTATIVNDD